MAAIYGFCIESAESQEKFDESLYGDDEEDEVVDEVEKQRRRREAIELMGGAIG